MAISYLIAENLTKSWGDKPLFQNLNININEGQKIALVAQNGSGKTNILEAICLFSGESFSGLDFEALTKNHSEFFF